MSKLSPVLWDVNKKKFITMGGGGGATIITAEEMWENFSSNLSDHTGSIYDSTSLTILDAPLQSTDNIGIAEIEGLDYGLYSVVLRMAIDTSIIPDNIELATVKCLYISDNVTKQIATARLFGSYFDVINKFVSLGFIINYSRPVSDPIEDKIADKLRIVLTSNGNIATNNKLYLDYIEILPAMPGVTAIPAILS